MSDIKPLKDLLESLSSPHEPKVPKSKITAITNLCGSHIANATSPDQVIANLLTTVSEHFYTSLNTHKIRVIYAFDAIMRQCVAKAKDKDKTAKPAWDSHAIMLLTPMMYNIIQHAPSDQKGQISKLIDIWEAERLVPEERLADFRRLLIKAPAPESTGASAVAPAQPQSTPVVSTTPSGIGSLLASLANVGQRQDATQTRNDQYDQYQIGAQYVIPMDPRKQNVGPVRTVPVLPSRAPQQLNQSSIAPVASVSPLGAQPCQSVPAGNEAFMQFIGSLVQQGWTPDQIAQVIAAMNGRAQGATSIPGASAAVQPAQAQGGFAQAASAGQLLAAQDYRTRDDPHDFDRNRDRSRSPDQQSQHASLVNRRESPTYGSYGAYDGINSPNGPNGGPGGANGQQSSEHGGNRRGGRKNRRGRDKHRNSPTIEPQQQQGQQQKDATLRPRYIEHDPTLPRGNIKVLSRTLFVGGVSATEQDLRQIFSRFGEVQTCIVNPEKHHAFVKMVNRNDSVKAKEGMEQEVNQQILNKARQTRWGVGFGPRECSDYNTGISVIPIDRLTEADRKWAATSEYGGTGGKPLVSGLVIEEPDIEIGTGVSSKAMSRRVAPEPNRKHGAYHGRRNFHGGHNGSGFDPNAPRFRKPDPRPDRPQGGGPRSDALTIGVPPAVPGFGFHFPNT